MRRLITIATAVAIAAALVPSTAGAAGTTTDTAKALERGGLNLNIRFKIITLNGKPVEIRRYRFNNLTARCANDTTVDVKGRIGSMDVNNRGRFKGRTAEPGKAVAVRGRVNNDGTRATGTIRATGRYGRFRNCDTGKVRWVAET